MKTETLDDLVLVSNADYHYTHTLFRQSYSINVRSWKTKDGCKYVMMIIGGPEGVAGHTDGVEAGDECQAAILAGEMHGRTLINLRDEMKRRGFEEKSKTVEKL